jgi:uncharacterized membrane protein YqiK
MDALLSLLAAGGALLALVALAYLSGLVRYIPNHRVGVVEKLFSYRHGSLKAGFIALRGETGFQPEVLRGGWHTFVPFQYAVHKLPLVTIPQGRLGYVFARDGLPLAQDQALAKNEDARDFTDVRAFLEAGGQRGPQRRVLREGTYAINLAQFIVLTDDRVYGLPLDRDEAEQVKRMATVIGDRHGFEPLVIRGTDDRVGIVTVHDGPGLGHGEIIAPSVGDTHDRFQDADSFLSAGGRRGRQLDVLVEGTWFINRLFATVELIPKTTVEVGCVGVVVSYTGRAGADLTGAEYKHGELVQTGERGTWKEPLLPGKYAFNTFAGRVVMVPTTNFILKWNRREVGAHRFDENLSEVSLITVDAYEPTLPLSVVVHIGYQAAPRVVQRFGDIKRLVEQTLDPMVAAYFKDIGQSRTLIQLIHERADIQRVASAEMRERFARYDLELEEVLIGTPGSAEGDPEIERILGQVRARQLADEQLETYARMERAALKERELREAEARAHQQTALTQSELRVAIEGNEGRAAHARAVQEAARIRALAEAEAERIARVGAAEAKVAEQQVAAYGGPRFVVSRAVMERFAQAVEKGGIPIVPRVVTGGGSGSAIESMLAVLLDEKTGADAAR